MKVTDKGTLCEAWLWNFKEPAPEGDIQMEYSSD
jgi:hypothetical protein